MTVLLANFKDLFTIIVNCSLPPADPAQGASMNLEPTGFLPAAKAAVTGAIRNAAQLTGTSFQYLLATARVESNLNAQAAASTSSAKGLFQFISQTWLATLKERGPGLGYARYAEAIERLPSGQYTVSDPKLHQQIMNLRTDPVASALMAGAFTRSNTDKLAASLGRAPTEGELYIAHFLGADGAAKLIELAQAQPRTPASQAFPGAAGANHSVFYDRQGRPRGAADVYQTLVNRYAVARAEVPLRAPPVVPVAPQVASVAAVPQPTPAPLVLRPPAPIPVAVARPAPPIPELVPSTPAPVVAPVVVPAGPPMPVFHGLFRSTGSEPVAPVVSALWGTPSAQPAQPTQPAPPAAASPPPQPVPADRPGGPLDLFQDRPPNVGALFRGRV